MSETPFDPSRVLVLVGPTASGKTGVALELAKTFPVEIVCMDSMQVYRELNVGTAKPSARESQAAPHHLFGCISVSEDMNCARYARMAGVVCRAIQKRGHWPLLVGGTGLYYRSLFGGMDVMPPTPPDLRRRMDLRRQKMGLPRMYRLLARLDPEGAASLHPNDRQRVQRFLEVRILTGRSILYHWKQAKRNAETQDLARPLTLGLQVPRPFLVERIKARTMKMLQAGWIEETQHLRDLGLMDRVRKVGPIGYALIEKCLAGEFSEKELAEKIFIQTRQYAKRQMTWFRKDSHITWFPFDRKSGYNVATISDLIGNRMT